MSTERAPWASDPTLRIDGPDALVNAVPYLLGFHPSDSLVLVGLAGGQLVVTSRIDLALARDAATVGRTVEILADGGARELVALVYANSTASDRFGAEAAIRPLIESVELAVPADCALVEVLLVTSDRWWSLGCDDPRCCPASGWTRPGEAVSPFAAAATFAGIAPLPDREALAATLDPEPARDRQRITALLAAAEQALADSDVRDGVNRRESRLIADLITAAASADEAAPCTLSDRRLARFGCGLRRARVRDRLWLSVDDGTIAAPNLWRELGRGLPSPYDAAPLFLYGWSAWRSGSGALATIAASRALQSDPKYSAAAMLLDVARRGINPERLPRLRGRRHAG